MRFPLRVAAATLMLSLPLPANSGPPPAGVRQWTIPNIAPGRLLEVQLRTGAGLSITTWDRNEVVVESDWLGTRCREVEFEAKQTDRGVRVETSYPPGTAAVTRHCSFGVEIKVPRKFDVRILSAGGSVAIHGLRGDVRGQTGGGKIELADLKGNVELRTGGGEIRVWDSDLEGYLSTGGGQVVFDNVSGGVTARTGSRPGTIRGGRVTPGTI